MRSGICGIAALAMCAMSGLASAHTDHAHVGKVFVPGYQSTTFPLLSKIRGGSNVTFLSNGIDCNEKEEFKGRGCGQCYPNCYLGTPCECCHHKAHYTHPCFKFGKLHRETVAAGNAIAIENPGLLARLQHKATFTPKR